MARLGQDLIDSAVEWARRGDRRRVVIFVDEYERFFDREVFPPRDSLRILEYLRGLVQKNPRSFSFIIAGLTRRFASRPTIGGRQNPLFNFMVDFPLSGLQKNELRDLLRKIGGRLGLVFENDAIDEIWAQTGGHPALARDYGRVIDQHIAREPRVDGVEVSRAIVMEHHDAYARHVNMSMLEIERSIKTIDQDCLGALRDLASNPASTLDILPAETLDQIHRLGIIARDDGRWKIAIGTFAEWLVANYPGSHTVSMTGS